jgi:hypothetical protein
MTAEHAHGIDAGGEVEFRPPCRDCGPGYQIGGDGCRHGDYQPAMGEAGVCRTCAKPIWWEMGAIGGRDTLGWSDRIERGGDSVVCFNAVGYRHVPLGGREAAIYKAATNTAADTVLAEARRLCCGNNPSAHHAATDKHSELMAFAGRLAGAVRGR